MLGSVLEVRQLSSSSARSSFGSASTVKESDKSFRKNTEHRVEEVSEFGQEQRVSYVDFEVQQLLGNGAFGKVYLARHRHDDQLYALKVLNKKKLFAKKQLKYAVGEASILKRVDSPFIVKLYYAFQTPGNLYMALDHCALGDLSELIAAREQLQEKTARFVIAQLVLAIEYLHRLGILYRDLKPENILIDREGYIKLTDFGLSRENSFATSFCGSPAYLSPEMLEKKGVGQSSDIYGIGCVLYEMVVGEPPFFNEDMGTLFENIKTAKLRFPSDLTIEVRSLISRLLERDLSKRLGVRDIGEIKQHDFFRKFEWAELEGRRMKAPAEMLANREEALGGIELTVKENIRLVDHDYNETTRMINRVKNFTFVREDPHFPAVPANILSLKSL
jgi:serine/threonine protein kinase